MSKKKTTQQFKDELYCINPMIEITGDYIDNKTAISYRCKRCSYTHKASPSMLLSGQGCPKCAIKRRASKRTKTHSQFMDAIKHSIHPNIEVIGEYLNSKTKIKCRCKICGYEFLSYPDNILRGHGCSKCEHNSACQKRRKTQDVFERELKDLMLNFTVIGEYVNAKTKILCKCNVCGYEWKSSPTNILNGKGCPKCANERNKSHQSISTEDFIKKLNKINPQIKVIGNYTNNATPIECKCISCGGTFTIIPRNLLTRGTCPLCTVSKGENKISQWLKDNNIVFEKEKTFQDLVGIGGGRLRFDFYLPDFKTIIEYNGLQHEKPIDFGAKGVLHSAQQYKSQQENYKLKKEYARKNNLNFIEIWYYDFDRIEEILFAEIRK